jgi:hypothetical protein
MAKKETEAQRLARRQNEIRRAKDRAVYAKVGSNPAGIKKKPLTARQKEAAAQAKHDAKYGTGKKASKPKPKTPEQARRERAAATRAAATRSAPSGYHRLVGTLGKKKEEDKKK